MFKAQGTDRDLKRTLADRRQVPFFLFFGSSSRPSALSNTCPMSLFATGTIVIGQRGLSWQRKVGQLWTTQSEESLPLISSSPRLQKKCHGGASWMSGVVLVIFVSELLLYVGLWYSPYQSSRRLWHFSLELAKSFIYPFWDLSFCLSLLYFVLFCWRTALKATK